MHIKQYTQQQKLRPVCIISDFDLGWTQQISAKSELGGLVNTFYDIDHLHTTTNKPVWPIGPILPPWDFNNSKDTSHPCFHWLDSQKPQSVLYVCLGNHLALSEEQMMELACGLEAMDKPFIWVNYSTTAIPKRFAEK